MDRKGKLGGAGAAAAGAGDGDAAGVAIESRVERAMGGAVQKADLLRPSESESLSAESSRELVLSRVCLLRESFTDAMGEVSAMCLLPRWSAPLFPEPSSSTLFSREQQR